MKTIKVNEELYRYMASYRQHIGKSASDILRRMLKFTSRQPVAAVSPREKALTTPLASDRMRPMRELLLLDEYAKQSKAIDRFMMVLSTLYTLDAVGFAAATDALHGRTRIYFASEQHTLLANGRHTKPKHFPGPPYWVITNTNTGCKRSIIEHIMRAMQFPSELTEKVSGTI